MMQEVVRGNRQRAMLATETIGHDLGVGQFVLALAAGKSDRERLYRFVQFIRHQGHNDARIDTSAEKRSEGNIAPQPQSHRFPQQGFQLFEVLAFTLWLRRCFGKRERIPILLGFDSSLARQQIMSGQQRMDASKQRAGCRDVF